jgi:hypothetical protein
MQTSGVCHRCDHAQTSENTTLLKDKQCKVND